MDLERLAARRVLVRALALRGDKHIVEEHGFNGNHAKNVRIGVLVGAGVVEVHRTHSQGVMDRRVVVKVNSSLHRRFV